MSANGYAISAVTRNAVFLQRLAGGEAKKVQSVLRAMQGDINNILNSATEADFNSGRVLAQIEQVSAERLETVNNMVRDSALDSAEYFSGFTSRLLREITKITPKTPDPQQVQLALLTNAINFKPTASAATLNDVINEFGTKKAAQFRQIVSDGILTGQTGPEMTKQVSEAMRLTLRQAETLVRTTTNSAAQVGRLQTYRENADILEGVENVAVLDHRTTMYCKQVDGKIQTLDEASRPPYHFGAIAGGEMVKTLFGDKPIEKVKVGDFVLTHKGRFMPVEVVMRKRNDSGMIKRIQIDSGRVFRATDDHPILFVGEGWQKAADITTGAKCFQYTQQKKPISSRLSVVEANPQDYPSLFDSGEVFSEVSTKTGSMAATIDFNSDFVRGVSDVTQGIFNNNLLFKPFKKLVDLFKNNLFAKRYIAKLSFPMPLHNCFNMLRVVCGVLVFHPFRMFSVYFAGIFVQAVSPMVNTAKFAASGFFAHHFGYGFLATLYCDPVLIAPPTDSAIGKKKLAFNLSDRFAKFKMMMVDKFLKIFPIRKVDNWLIQRVCSIKDVEYKDYVYNLGVSQDESYTVNGVIVHNCRTQLVPVVNKEYQDPRASGERNAEGGKVTPNTTYGAWLKRQSKGFQDEALGPERAALFRTGELNLESFVDQETGKTYTLDQLRALEPLAFEKAGL